MFVLCTLALMGTEDQLMQSKSKAEVWSRLGWWGRLELRVRTRLVLFKGILSVGVRDSDRSWQTIHAFLCTIALPSGHVVVAD